MNTKESAPTAAEKVGDTIRYLIHAWVILAASVIMYAAADPWIDANAAEPRVVTAAWLAMTLGALYLVSRQY